MEHLFRRVRRVVSSNLSSVMAPLGIAGVWTKTEEKLLEPVKEENQIVEVKWQTV